ncbi:permease-like cell division protein FtsX [Catenuloplanes sp. NPDC051500]|uniref:permease-like cell division protein FtsX n=1 Tax=Catenuloplanes sp. NPDC051500 TaxID=3363959 RepID=UPI00378BA762
MDQELRDIFGMAVADEPVPLGDITRDAMAHGTRIRRRRRLLGGSAAAVALVAVLGAVNLVPGPDAPPAGATSPPAAMLPLAMAGSLQCAPRPDPSTEFAMFLRTDITDAQLQELDRRLSGDDLVESFEFESRDSAFQKFAELWKDSPELVGSVVPEQMPESFRIRLTDAGRWDEVATRYGGAPGVDQMLSQVCTGAPR